MSTNEPSSLACGDCNGRCCTHYVVPVTGHDLFTIVRAQHLAPEQVVQHLPEEQPSPTGFLLRSSGVTHSLALRHQPARRNERPCVFLLRLRNGYQRCGIYQQRPLVCQAYPVLLHQGVITLREDMLCPPGSWAEVSSDAPPWRELLLRMEQEWAVYETLVQRWNQQLRSGSQPVERALAHYLGYLLNCYAEIEQLRPAIPVRPVE